MTVRKSERDELRRLWAKPSAKLTSAERIRLHNGVFAVLNALDEADWRLMDTAPRDGTPILLDMGAGYGACMGWWRGNLGAHDGSYPWVFCDGQDTLNGARKDHPLAWQPLPRTDT